MVTRMRKKNLVYITQAKLRYSVHQSKKSLTAIAEESGIPYSWLWRFYHGRMQSHDAERTQTLYEYLSGKQLKV